MSCAPGGRSATLRRRTGACGPYYVRLAGRWVYAYRAIDEHGQVIDVYLSETRDTAAATALMRLLFPA